MGPTISRARSTSASVTEAAFSLAFKEPGPRSRAVVEDALPLCSVRETLNHSVEAVDHGVGRECRDPDRAERAGFPPRLGDPADIARADEASAELGLVDEHPHRWLALGERVEFVEQLHDGFRLS